MSFFKTLPRKVFAALLLVPALALSACTFTPVYQDTSKAQTALNLAYANPNTRLEQLVYQELRLRFGSSESAEAPLASVTVSTGVADLVLSQTANPSKPKEVTATVTLTITPRSTSGEKVTSYTRRATANYTSNGQVLADKTAESEAAERATRSATESLRLAVLAGLSR